VIDPWIEPMLEHVERSGGWIATIVGGFILKKLIRLDITFDGLNVKYVKGEKRESFREGQQNERERGK